MTYDVAIQLKYLAQVRRGAVRNHAKKMVLHNQGYGPLRERLAEQKAEDGVCRTLSVRWLASQRSGSDFLASLVDRDADKGPGEISAAAVASIVTEFKTLPARQTENAQAAHLRTELQQNGFTVGDTNFLSGPSKLKGKSLAEWFCANEEAGPYRILGIRGGTAHAMALNLTPDHCAFYDPTFGEFQFPDKIDLENFLTTVMFEELTFFMDPLSKASEQAQKAAYKDNVASINIAYYAGSRNMHITRAEMTACT